MSRAHDQGYSRVVKEVMSDYAQYAEAVQNLCLKSHRPEDMLGTLSRGNLGNLGNFRTFDGGNGGS
jgi:hypothetical protein